jgi:hypothetical protein
MAPFLGSNMAALSGHGVLFRNGGVTLGISSLSEKTLAEDF